MKFKITKYTHSCLLVETDNRVALFDPGAMITSGMNIDALQRLDDILITHAHGDHFDIDFIKKLVEKFPDVRIITTPEMVEQLAKEGLKATDQPSEGIKFFDAPHEPVEPLFPLPQEIGIHYLDSLSHPGDSHSFSETKAILALPVTGPWGANVTAVKLALELKPKYILPIHDWHWSEQARDGSYDSMEKKFAENDIKFLKLEDGKPIEIEL